MTEDKEFKVPDIIFNKRKKHKLTTSACILYVHYCALCNKYGDLKWFYISTKTLLSFTNFKKATLFNAKRQLIKHNLIRSNKNNYIHIPHLWRIINET